MCRREDTADDLHCHHTVVASALTAAARCGARARYASLDDCSAPTLASSSAALALAWRVSQLAVLG